MNEPTTALGLSKSAGELLDTCLRAWYWRTYGWRRNSNEPEEDRHLAYVLNHATDLHALVGTLVHEAAAGYLHPLAGDYVPDLATTERAALARLNRILGESERGEWKDDPVNHPLVLETFDPYKRDEASLDRAHVNAALRLRRALEALLTSAYFRTLREGLVKGSAVHRDPLTGQAIRLHHVSPVAIEERGWFEFMEVRPTKNPADLYVKDPPTVEELRPLSWRVNVQPDLVVAFLIDRWDPEGRYLQQPHGPRFLVLDWKTGQPSATDKIQVALYSLWVRHQLAMEGKQKDARIGLVLAYLGAYLEAVTVSTPGLEEQGREALQRWATTARGLLVDGDHARNQPLERDAFTMQPVGSAACRWCRYRALCGRLEVCDG